MKDIIIDITNCPTSKIHISIEKDDDSDDDTIIVSFIGEMMTSYSLESVYPPLPESSSSSSSSLSDSSSTNSKSSRLPKIIPFTVRRASKHMISKVYNSCKCKQKASIRNTPFGNLFCECFFIRRQQHTTNNDDVSAK